MKSKGSGNYKDLDKTRVKLFPNFTRHHLITHTNCIVYRLVQSGERDFITLTLTKHFSMAAE